MFEGMTYFNLALFGQESAKYRDFWNAHLFTYYAMDQTEYNHAGEVFSSVNGSLWTVLNYLAFYYISVIVFYGLFMAITVQEHVFCEMTNFEPAVDREGNYVHETKEALGVREYIKYRGVDLILWFVSWLPEERVYKLKLNLLGDEALD